jgi:2-polyprenyl-3-methyl-5-hydroxy-6-metoxy-1,4-benzoquinol methylase
MAESNLIHEFPFKELDPEGMETLLAISHADAFNKWMYDTISPHVYGSILEIGSGIGNISKFFLNDHRNLTLSDIRENYCQLLEQYFESHANIQGILQIDLADSQFSNRYAHLLGTFDSVFALNVVEHIKEDNLAIINAGKLLKQGGTLVVLVPAFQKLYNKLDSELHHYRRYNRKQLRLLLNKNGFNVRKAFYFNASAIPAWFVSGSLLRQKIIGSRQMAIFNRVVPVARIIDYFLRSAAGLSVIAVGEKS